MANPLVSVILPVRNGGDYLAAAVASILNQDMPDLELLLVDDHSTDGAVRAVDGADRRLQRLQSKGKGVVNAFASGRAAARGRFIARMDADDIALPGRLSAQLSYLEDNPGIDIAGGCVQFFSGDGVEAGNLHYQEWLNALRTPAQIHRQLFIESPIPNPTALFRAGALDALGGYRDCGWPEDYDLYLRADAAGMKMGKPEGILLQWRDHPGRLTRTNELYARERFQRAKAHFLARHRLPAKNMLIWGAGPTGRQMHDLLRAEGVETHGFVEIHPRRIGGEKRGKPVQGIERVTHGKDEFILVAVGARGARAQIGEYMHAHGLLEGRDFLFVA